MNTFLLLSAQLPQGGFMQFLPIILLIVVFWFFMIRPQMKRQKELKNFRDALQKGDKVVTTGGIYGKVAEIHDQYLVIDCDSNVRLRIDKSAILKDMYDAAK